MLRISALLFLVLTSALASADESPFHYYLHIKAGSLTLDDPDGDTNSPTLTIPGLLVNYDLNTRGLRALLSVDYIDVEFDGNMVEIEQEASGYSFALGLERRFALSRKTKIWAGASIKYMELDFENRFTVDDEGFLDQGYNDRSASYFVLSLHSDIYFALGEKAKLGLGGFVDFSDELNIFGIRLSLGL